MTWEDEFRQRMNEFKATSQAHRNGIPVSIKIRVSDGCFHREHSPHAYQIIDEYRQSHPFDNFTFVEHENGPELLVYLSLIAAGVTLTASVIDFITTIIRARSEGIKYGDRKSERIELVLRGFDEDGQLKEVKALEINSRRPVSRYHIEKTLMISANKMIPKKQK